MSANVHDNNPVLPFVYASWNKRGLTWRQACEEAAEVMHLAVKLDAVRVRDRKARKAARRRK